MADFMLKCNVGLRLANWTSSLTYASSALNGASYMGPLYDSDASSYAGLQMLKAVKVTDVSINGVDPMLETFTVVDDPYEYDIHIRDQGGISFEIYEQIDTSNGTLSEGILWASKNFPSGATTSTATNITYDALSDNNGGTAATDLRGYTAVVEWRNPAGDAFRRIWFRNCRLKATPSPAPQRASKIRVELSDARIVTVEDGTSTSIYTS